MAYHTTSVAFSAPSIAQSTNNAICLYTSQKETKHLPFHLIDGTTVAILDHKDCPFNNIYCLSHKDDIRMAR